MHPDVYEELVQLEAEELAEALFGTCYFNLPPRARLFLRAKVIESLAVNVWDHVRLPVAAA